MTDALGNPLPGADVWLVDNSYLEFSNVTSDVNGHFEFKNIDPSGIPSFKPYASYSSEGNIYRSEPAETWYTTSEALIAIGRNDTQIRGYPQVPGVVSKGPFLMVTGTVTDRNGEPVSGASVRLLDDIYRELSTISTAKDGKFFFNVSAPLATCVKVQVSYYNGEKIYRSELQNTRWYTTNGLLVEIEPADSRLFAFPEPGTGYLYGVITDERDTRAIDGVVYLMNSTTRMSINTTSNAGVTGFYQEVTPGDYTVYAVHDENGAAMLSDLINITIPSSSNLLEAPPTILTVRQIAAETAVKPLPLLLACILAIIVILATGVILRKL